ncbi:type I polyketide synthase, partial [Aquimarina aggregata]|uniref:type I polyketide synthase n=1 Tax=Aquimarina aggregata TaxID=1642818 RepID=UPI002490A176
KAMEERLVIKAESIADVIKGLQNYIDKKYDAENLFVGNASNEETIEQTTVNDIKSLAISWVNGVNIDWKQLYTDKLPRRMSLPTYPFAKKSHWVAFPELVVSTQRLDPLIHTNNSTWNQQKYTSVFSYEDSFFEEKLASANTKSFASFCYIEMIRKAGLFSLEQSIVRLQNITFDTAFTIEKNESKQIQTRIFSNEKGNMLYEIYSDDASNKITHNQGEIFIENQDNATQFDITSIQSNYHQLADTIQYNDSEYFTDFKYANDKEEIEFSLILEQKILKTLQSVLKVEKAQEVSLQLTHIEAIHIYESVVIQHCYIQKHTKDATSTTAVFDIHLLNASGKEVIALQGVQLSITISNVLDTVFFKQEWKQEAVIKNGHGQVISTDHQIILCGVSKKSIKNIKSLLGENQEVIHIEKNEDAVLIYKRVFEIIKSNIKKSEQFGISVIFDESERIMFGFLSGLLKTARIENRNLKTRTIGVQNIRKIPSDVLYDMVSKEIYGKSQEVKYIDGIRSVKKLQELTASEISKTNISFKNKGVYLIIGGSGGLGKLVAKEISEKYKATIILTGRSTFTSDKDRELTSIPGCIYKQCDVGNYDDVVTLVNQIKEEHKQLNGIIHSAGIIKDQLISSDKKSLYKEVLTAKTKGIKNIDLSTQDMALDFMICFSSIAGVLGNIGQADYASANMFLDTYTDYRNSLVAEGKRSGVTLSVNWPIWEYGGMQVEQDIFENLRKKGVFPLPNEQGLEALMRIMSLKVSRVMVLYGVRNKIIEELIPAKTHSVTVDKSHHSKKQQQHSEVLMQVVQKELAAEIAAILKLKTEDITADADLGDYGLDSISMRKLTNKINEKYKLM